MASHWGQPLPTSLSPSQVLFLLILFPNTCHNLFYTNLHSKSRFFIPSFSFFLLNLSHRNVFSKFNYELIRRILFMDFKSVEAVELERQLPAAMQQMA